jgi:hypothetical protein
MRALVLVLVAVVVVAVHVVVVAVAAVVVVVMVVVVVVVGVPMLVVRSVVVVVADASPVAMNGRKVVGGMVILRRQAGGRHGLARLGHPYAVAARRVEPRGEAAKRDRRRFVGRAFV